MVNVIIDADVMRINFNIKRTPMAKYKSDMFLSKNSIQKSRSIKIHV